jgi:hypothetical protein
VRLGGPRTPFSDDGTGAFLPFIFGSRVGVMPWLIIAFFVVAPFAASPAEPPAFVYG